MSQKTNPLSLRLHKKNQNFCSPWFTDFFFSDNFRHELEIRKYINALFEETLYSNAFFSVKSWYRKFNFLIAIQDTRALRKEKQLLFNIKSHLFSRPTVMQNKVLQTVEKNNRITSRCFIEDKTMHENVILKENTTLLNPHYPDLMNPPFSRMKDTEDGFKSEKCEHLKSLIRRKVRNNFLKLKQNYNLQSFSPHQNIFSPKIDTFNSSFINTDYFNGKIKDRNCFSFSEKIVSKQKKIPILSSFIKDSLIKVRKSRSSTLEKSFSNCLLNNKLALQTSEIQFFPGITNIQPIRFINYTQNVIPLLDLIVILLEKRVTFREIKSKIFKDLSKNNIIKGVRISCSGRLGGRSKKAQKAKIQSHQWGETSLNTFSSKVIFARKSAITSYGKVGIKIWISFI